MLWGILNAVISARYISRKVSENCFVLLEQRLGNELTGFSWQFVHRHPSTASPAICIQALGPPLRCPLSLALRTRRSLASVDWCEKRKEKKKRSVSWGGEIRVSSTALKARESPCWVDGETESSLVWGSKPKLLSGKSRVCLLLRSSAFLIVVPFSLCCLLVSQNLSFPPGSICPSVRPIWLRWRALSRREESGVERGMERQLEPSQTRRNKLPL